MEKIILFAFNELKRKEEEVFLCFFFTLNYGSINNRFFNLKIKDEIFPVLTKKYSAFSKLLTAPEYTPMYHENGDIINSSNIWDYWEEYARGFKEGYDTFSKSLQTDLKFYNDNEYIGSILTAKITEPIEGSLFNYSNNIDGSKYIIKRGFYDFGIISGEYYRAWVFIVKQNKTYVNVLRNLFGYTIKLFKYAHENNDFKFEKLLNQTNKKEFTKYDEILSAINSQSARSQIVEVSTINELFREIYQERYLEFFEALKNEELINHPKKNIPYLNNYNRLNGFTENSINVLMDTFIELKVFKSITGLGKNMNKYDALRVLRNYLGYETEYKKSTNPQINNDFKADFSRIIKKILAGF